MKQSGIKGQVKDTGKVEEKFAEIGEEEKNLAGKSYTYAFTRIV